ncbi:hypothetical protein F5I97DRAFT_1619559 [Phlebopus sp. FC_14]|nr:hypothetical protein F5I97DRAFT_1619559 [Phlebopus sp. FC_14]
MLTLRQHRLYLEMEGNRSSHQQSGKITFIKAYLLHMDARPYRQALFFRTSRSTYWLWWKAGRMSSLLGLQSVLLREIIRIRGGRGSSTLAITASTGIASVNIGGTTVHSWAGIGLGQESAKKLAGKFLGQKKFENVLNRWRRVQTLVLDEISMIDGVLFDKLKERGTFR